MLNLKQSTLLAATLAFCAGQASAELFIYEPFDYAHTNNPNDGGTPGVTFLGDGNQTGGLGLGTWSQVNSGSNEIDVNDGGLTYNDGFGNDLAVTGNALERQVRQGSAAVNAPITSTPFAVDGTTTWMTFLYQDRGFSGPDFGISLGSEDMVNGDGEALAASGVGVGIGINGVGGPARAIGSIVADNTTGFTFTPEAVASMDGPSGSNVRLLALKINWNADGTDDEIFVFDLTTAAGSVHDITTTPAEGSAIATALVDFSAAEQASIDTLGINESQVNFLDEIRVADNFAEAVGIPEPSSLALLGLGGLLIARRRRG